MNNLTGIAAFLAVILLSVILIARAARRSGSASAYYTAGGSISAGRNGFALAGDFISAGGFLGLTGLVARNGLDAAVYAIGVLASWPLMLLLFAAPLKRLGRYTLADVVTNRLGSERLRILTAGNQVIIILLGLTSNLVGSMVILKLLFSLSPAAALTVIAVMMTAYVLLGGMLAATWLQIIKAALLMLAMTAILGIALSRFGFDLDFLLAEAQRVHGPSATAPGTMYKSGSETLSLLLGLALGGASMPHVLMRMNTVPDAAAARRSAFLATGIVVVFHIMLVMVGMAAMSLLDGASIKADPGGNMTLPLLGQLLGGQALLGVISAIAFTTMLAVMSGQCIAGSAALSYDIWAIGLRQKSDERGGLAAGRVASVVLLACALGLAYACRNLNIGFIAACTMAIAASANFPTLILAISWTRLSPAGAAAGMITGLVISVGVIVLSPLVQVGVLHNAAGIISLQYPALVAVPLAFLVAISVSLITSPRPVAERVTAHHHLAFGLAIVALTLLSAFAMAVTGAHAFLSHKIAGATTVYAVSLLAMALAIWAIAGIYFKVVSRREQN